MRELCARELWGSVACERVVCVCEKVVCERVVCVCGKVCVSSVEMVEERLCERELCVREPRAISATPATQSARRCHQVPRMPHKVQVDVTKCHACHTK